MDDTIDRQVQERRFGEMIDARGKIQAELLHLLQFERDQRDHLQASRNLRVVGLLSSAGFSLWRAAFLFPHGEGDADEYLANVDRFLSKIISDNTIAFVDDKNTWSLWHYIGVARSSLLEALSLLRHGFDRYDAIDARLRDAPLLQDTAAEQWNELFGLMVRLRGTLSASIETMRKMRTLDQS